jgi:hypothetical protein
MVDKLEVLRQKAQGQRALDIERLKHYLVSHASGLKDYRFLFENDDNTLRRTGAMEGNVDKLIVRRMKNQGMSWSPKGIRSMLFVRFKVLEKKLEAYLYGSTPKTNIHVLEKKKVNRVIDKMIHQNYVDYFNAGLPALFGPHASRPWAKILKSLTEA